jgi:hypothetical protein
VARRRAQINWDEFPPGAKMIAKYGHCTAKVNVLERVWKTRRDGIRQRYWMKTGKTEIRDFSGRFEFYGTGKDLYRAVMMTDHLVPRINKPYQVVSAKDFIKNPHRYSQVGYWTNQEVVS